MPRSELLPLYSCDSSAQSSLNAPFACLTMYSASDQRRAPLKRNSGVLQGRVPQIVFPCSSRFSRPSTLNCQPGTDARQKRRFPASSSGLKMYSPSSPWIGAPQAGQTHTVSTWLVSGSRILRSVTAGSQPEPILAEVLAITATAFLPSRPLCQSFKKLRTSFTSACSSLDRPMRRSSRACAPGITSSISRIHLGTRCGGQRISAG